MLLAMATARTSTADAPVDIAMDIKLDVAIANP
jgi:hypothetical protein